MSLIQSISGIRGTIGGAPQDGLNPLNLTQFTIAYAQFIKQAAHNPNPHIVIGRDARLSGEMVQRIVSGTLISLGCHVTYLGLATTPTTEMAVTGLHADGGIIITASHNPKHWNALKLLNSRGEFLSDADGKALSELMLKNNEVHFAEVDSLGSYKELDYLPQHIAAILALPEVDKEAIAKANFAIAFDSINSVGGIAVPQLLKALGVQTIFPLFDEPSGKFAHNPEPLPQHLVALSNEVRTKQAHLGISVDPDVDRLALYDENGEPFGEEYTLVAVADYLLQLHNGGNTVSNLSSTRALRDVTEKWYKGNYAASAVGEVNVVSKMKETGALIGGEGNGGVILPALHYGRDALVGIALFLTYLAKKKCTVSELKKSYPEYFMSKERLELPQPIAFSKLIPALQKCYEGETFDVTDGIKFDFADSWLHIRASNTEPILRIYTEAGSPQQAQEVAHKALDNLRAIIEQTI